MVKLFRAAALAAVAATSLALWSGPSFAAPQTAAATGGIVVPTRDDVQTTVLSGDAGDTLGYSLQSPTAVDVCDGCLPGDTADLGTFDAGTALVFELTDVTVGGTFLSTDPDHAQVTQDSATQWTIRWDDAGGDMDFNDLETTVHVGPPATSLTTLTVDPSGELPYGQRVTLTASVANNAGSTGKPTGTVTFSVNGTALGSPVKLKSATQTAIKTNVQLPIGADTVVATYNGDATHSTSSDGRNLQIDKADCSVSSFTQRPATAHIGKKTTFKLTFTPPTGSKVTGTVSFSDNGITVGNATLKNSAATFAYTFTTTGDHEILADYAGDTATNPCQNTLDLTVK